MQPVIITLFVNIDQWNYIFFEMSQNKWSEKCKYKFICTVFTIYKRMPWIRNWSSNLLLLLLLNTLLDWNERNKKIMDIYIYTSRLTTYLLNDPGLATSYKIS